MCSFAQICHFFIDFDFGLTPGVFFGDLFLATDFLAEGLFDLLLLIIDADVDFFAPFTVLAFLLAPDLTGLDFWETGFFFWAFWFLAFDTDTFLFCFLILSATFFWFLEEPLILLAAVDAFLASFIFLLLAAALTFDAFSLSSFLDLAALSLVDDFFPSFFESAAFALDFEAFYLDICDSFFCPFVVLDILAFFILLIGFLGLTALVVKADLIALMISTPLAWAFLTFSLNLALSL